MLRLGEILGQRDDPRFAGRAVDELPVTWAEAGRRRLRRMTSAGIDAAVELPRGAFLADGAVLHDDGVRVIAVARTREPALVIRISRELEPDERVQRAALLGHAFGNQHVPVDLEGADLRVPLTTSEAVARFTVDALGLSGLTVTVEEVALARRTPLHASAHGHDVPA